MYGFLLIVLVFHYLFLEESVQLLICNNHDLKTGLN